MRKIGNSKFNINSRRNVPANVKIMSENDQQFLGKVLPSWARPFASLLVCAMSSFVMTTASIAVKKMDSYYAGGILLVVMARFLVMFLLCTPILYLK